ncbi:hypothetical protein [Halomicrobium salinisoli]|uniref:hypothetical protein n=1 Tax=Halomicrobium salinisoli TaxID=2878391 RepID=UPI001CEFBF76|nr:hypothetical protein [Halomicrobium salinisoli]
MVSVPRPTVTLLAVLVVGAAATGLLATGALAPDGDGRGYEATAFDPETEADVLAHRANGVTNLTADADTNRARRLLDRAAGGETVEISEDDDLSYLGHQSEYAVYGGEYYYLNGTERNGSVRIELDPRTPDEAMDELAVPYDETRPNVQRVVDRGNATVRPPNGSARFGVDAPSVVVRDGTYYVLNPTNQLWFFGQFAALLLAPIVSRIGAVYLATGLGVAGLSALAERRRVLDLQTAVALAVVAALAHGLLAGLLGSGVDHWTADADLVPALAATVGLASPSGLSLGAMLAVGVALRAPRESRDVLLAGGLVVAAVLAGGVLSAVATGIPTPVLTALFGGIPGTVGLGFLLALLGYVHAAPGGGDGDVAGRA